MTAVLSRQGFSALIVAAAGLIAGPTVHAGAQVMFYVTVPLGVASKGRVFGLRLDKTAVAPNVHIINPDSPLNRRALLDLQVGADLALRLDLDRRLTWDIGRQEWRLSSRPATFTLRVPLDTATRAKPTADQDVRALVKSRVVEP